MLFNNIEEQRRKKELEKIRKENLKYINLLEQKMNANSDVNTIKKACIIPNFECSSINGIDYKISVDIKIRVDKPYVVKNIRDFIYLINNNAIR